MDPAFDTESTIENNNVNKRHIEDDNISIIITPIGCLHFWRILKASIYFKRSRSLTQLSRQFKPRTNFGHAPLSKQSWKSFQSVNPYYVLSWWVSPCCVKLNRIFHTLCAFPSIHLSFPLAKILPLKTKNS